MFLVLIGIQIKLGYWNPSFLTMQCITEPSSPPLPGSAPQSSNQPSPINIRHEFMLTVNTNSYNEMWSRIQVYDQDQIEIQDNEASQGLLLSQVLQPNRQLVEETLSHSKPTTFTRLITNYFNHSEKATALCVALYYNIRQARDLYKPLFELIEILPDDLRDISELQFNSAFDIFLKYDGFDNPFPCPDSHKFEEVQLHFSELKLQLDHRIRKSRSRKCLLRRASIGSFCYAYIAGNMKKRELAHTSQLDAAAKGTYVLNNDLDTIDRLVARLYTVIEGDKLLIHLALERGRDTFPIREVMKQLRKHYSNLVTQLEDLEQHICLCFNTVNRSRSLLLQEINLHQNPSP